jgi:hypothetical protein
MPALNSSPLPPPAGRLNNDGEFLGSITGGCEVRIAVMAAGAVGPAARSA